MTPSIEHGIPARLWRGTEDFLGSEWTRGCDLSIALNHRGLEPDGPPARRAYASESDLSACGTHRQAGADQQRPTENQNKEVTGVDQGEKTRLC